MKRVFASVISDLSPASLETASKLFHPSYTQHVDGESLDREKFITMMRSQKSKLASPPIFVWKRLVATAPLDGRIHVTSVHSTSARLRTGTSMLQHVMALIEIDVESGTIIACDELTRMEQGMDSQPRTAMPVFEAGSNLEQPAGGSSRRPSMERPRALAPPAKISKSSWSDLDDSSAMRLRGVPLTRTGISGLLADMGGVGLGLSAAATDAGRSFSFDDRTETYDESDCESFGGSIVT